ncbi:MAG: PQQ-like beta-propeller repeat protein [Dysgonamonadaceae bacterium]|nr:PQQ-like beta-propeller repeat protein [Dysgonamonadaceae bacterium]
MKHLLLALALVCSTYSFGQKTNLPISVSAKIAGKNLQNEQDIIGTEYAFPDIIYKTFLDTVSGLLTVQLRGTSKNEKWLNNTGHILQYDLNEQKLMWSKKIAYLTSELLQAENVMIYMVHNKFGSKSSSLDIYTGKELWKSNHTIYHIDPINRIGVGYKPNIGFNSKNKLEGIDLDNGNALWKMNLNREYGWNDAFHINDSTLIVVASGLHSINILNGDGWDYEAITGVKDYTGTVAAAAIGLAAGLLTGTFLIPTGYDLVSDLGSNVLMDDLDFYFSSKEKLVRIDKQTGEIIWEQPLPKDLTGKSTIFIEDDRIFMINEGIAFVGNRQVSFGGPFIAAFDRETGKQIFMATTGVKKDPILSYQLTGNEILLAFKDRLTKYTKETGQFIMERNFHKNEFGELKYFIGNQAFVVNENDEFVSLSQTDTTKIFVLTNKDNVLVLNNQLDITHTIAQKDLNICYLKTEKSKFITKDEGDNNEYKTWIIDNSGKKIAEIETSPSSFLIDKILYNQQKNKFIVIDLAEVID